MTGISINAIKQPIAVPNANAQFKLTAPPIKSLTVLPRPAPIIAPKPTWKRSGRYFSSPSPKNAPTSITPLSTIPNKTASKKSFKNSSVNKTSPHIFKKLNHIT